MPGCVNCLEIVGIAGHVVGTLGAFLAVRFIPGETVHSVIKLLLEGEQEPPRYMN
jgi:hypothetical protein